MFIRIGLVTVAGVMLSALVAAHAQGTQPGAVQRSVEDTQSRLPVKPGGNIPVGAVSDGEEAISLDRLDAMEFEGSTLSAEIQRYWATRIGRSLSEEQVNAFKAWVRETASTKGFMAFAQVVRAGEHSIKIGLVLPRINTVKVVAENEELAKAYVNRLGVLLDARFKPGMPVDIVAMEQRLEKLGFSRPIELSITIRAVAPELLDVIVNVAEAANPTGDVLGGIVQVNNYGLKQFGNEQLVGQLVMGGHIATSKLTLTGQKSRGIDYAKAEYDMPLESLDARLHGSLGYTQSEGILGGQSNSKNESAEQMIGLEKILGGHRDVIIKGAMDVSQRDSRSKLSSNGEELNRVQDQQLRFRFSADNERLSIEPLRLEIQAVQGNYATLVNAPNVSQGEYSKLEFNARKQFHLTQDGRWYGLAKLRGQFASRHLDSGNQFTLGGVNGVRAYTTADGSGDDGVQATLEVNFKSQSNHTFGIFYDGGVVRASATPLTGVYSDPYSLQAVGIQISGNAGNWFYNWTVAKGFGGNKGALPTDIESTPDNWRSNASLTYVY